MLWGYIDDTERQDDITESSIVKVNQIQQRADELRFDMFQGSKPSENEDIKMYKGALVDNASGATINLKDSYQVDVNMFYAGQRLFVRIGDSDEEIVIVQSYDEDNRQIILESAPSGTVSEDDKIGELIFGGVISNVEDENVEVLENLEYRITATDYSKIFDRKLIADTWQERDARYIINDFCNTTINYNHLIDDMDYENNTAIQAEWIEGGDGNNPTTDSSDFREGDYSGVFSWTNSGGTATFSATPAQSDVQDWTGVASGAPTEGILGFHWKISDNTTASQLRVRIGSDSSNYAEYRIDTPTDEKWAYVEIDLVKDLHGVTGTPDWENFDYMFITIVESADGNIKFDGFRFLQNDFFRHYPYVEETPEFTELRSPALKPMQLMQTIAGAFEYVWWIDYERNIHFKDRESDTAPFELTNTSDNFKDLSVGVDSSQIGNRIRVRGGEKNADNTRSEVFEGDNNRRNFKLAVKFAFTDFSILINDGSTSNAAEVGTTTTNIKITGHGLSTGDHVVNTTRGAVREITKVDNNNFTVEAVASQTNGDTITFFDTSKTIGIEGLVDETTVDFVGNQDGQSIRATASEDTLDTGEYIRVEYYEKVPINPIYSDSASISALKAAGFGDGIFDLDPYVDRNIDDLDTALAIAQAQVQKYSNPIVKGSFQTDQHGLSAGQIISIEDTIRSFDEDHVIQKVVAKQRGGEFGDYFEYKVTFATTMFEAIEFFQKLLAISDKIQVNEDAIVETYVTADEMVDCSDTNSVATNGGFLTASEDEDVDCDDTNNVYVISSGAWQFEPSVGQPIPTRFGLADFG